MDTVAAIKNQPSGNYLISDLGIFTPVFSRKSHAQVLDIVETQVSELEQVARYGTEVNSIKMDKPLLRDQEIPHYATEADVKTEDWQGLVSPTQPDQEAAISEVIVNKSIRMRNYHLETVESTLARTLFKQVAKAAKINDGDVDFTLCLVLPRWTLNLTDQQALTCMHSLRRFAACWLKSTARAAPIWIASIASAPRISMTHWRATRK
ncbi:hypothetical protein [Pseudescherichia vulneris]|uniref:hypothetical protein n=1 Tax=Pseudescherichia vulneris TaxID=566 RepID=UPI0028AC3F54|nr:hypothetical protein [Pseudescherichia vulneris]